MREISSIITYLHDIHGYGRIQPWFAESLKEDSAQGGVGLKSPEHVTGLLGIEYVRVRTDYRSGMVVLNANREETLDIGGFDQMLRGQRINSESKQGSFQGGRIAYRANASLDTLTISVRRTGGAIDSLQIGLRKSVEALVDEYGTANSDRVPLKKMVLEGVHDSLHVRVCLWSVRVQRQESGMKILSYETDILFKSP